MEISNETLLVIQKIAKSLSHKFKFDCYDRDDAEQEAILCGIKGLKTWKEEKGPVENYLRVVMRTRMINYKRNMDRSKKVIPKDRVKQEVYEVEFDQTEVEYISEKLDPENRMLFIKLSQGGKLTLSQKEQLYSAVKEVIEDENENRQVE